MTTNGRSKVERMILNAIERFKLGLEVEYDLTLGWGPLQQEANQSSQFVFAYWCFMSTPSPLLGHKPMGVLMALPDLYARQPDIDDAVLLHMSLLREQRAQVLSTANGKGEPRG
jgi:hypothetical protein